MQLGKAEPENIGCGNQYHYDGQGVHAVSQHSPNSLPVQSLVDKHADNQAVDNSNRCGLCGRKHAAYHAKYNYQHSCQCPEGNTQLLNQVDDAELLALRVIALNGNDIGSYHQRYGQQCSRNISCQEKASHGDAACRGGIDDHIVAGRHQQSLTG